MKIKLVPVLVVIALLAGGAAAATKKVKQETISLDRPALIGATVLPAGSYQLELVAGTDIARFLQQDRTVAELPCKVGFAQVVYGGNAVAYRTGGSGPDRLIKIVLTRSKIAIVFPSESDVEQAAF